MWELWSYVAKNDLLVMSWFDRDPEWEMPKSSTRLHQNWKYLVRDKEKSEKKKIHKMILKELHEERNKEKKKRIETRL